MKIALADFEIAKTKKNKDLIDSLAQLVYGIDLMINAEIKAKTKIRELSLQNIQNADILQKPDTDKFDDLLTILYDIKTDRESLEKELSKIGIVLLDKYEKTGK